MKFKLALLAAAGSVAMLSGANAQEHTGYYGALGAGVVLDNDDIDFESDAATPAFDTDISADMGIALYGAIGKYYDNGWRGELELATRSQDIEQIEGDGLGFAGFPSDDDLGEWTVSTLMVNVYKDFKFDAAGVLEPYVGAGIGAARVRPEFDNVQAPTAGAGGPQFSNRVVVGDQDFVPAFQGMVGLTYDFSSNMMVDLRYRYLRTAEVSYDGYVNSPDVSNELVALSSEYDAHEILAGFRWNFAAAPVVQEPVVQYKTCFDGSRVEVTQDCPPQIETVDATADFEPLVVYFDYDKSNLTDAARTLIAARAEEALDLNVQGVNVQGNTDTSGSSAYNQALSARRASVVRDALVSNGISSTIIAVEALGESNPAKPTADGVREPLNRRTEVTFDF